MICKHCGELLSDSAKFCTACGAPQTASQTAPKKTEIPVYEGQVVGSAKSIGFLEAVKRVFQHYADFKGRSRRSEYWWFCLFNMIVAGIVSVLLTDFAWVWSLVVLVPGLALSVRRLHDVGKSGWYYLWMFLPLAGPIMILIQLCKDSTENNQWGPNPKA